MPARRRAADGSVWSRHPRLAARTSTGCPGTCAGRKGDTGAPGPAGAVGCDWPCRPSRARRERRAPRGTRRDRAPGETGPPGPRARRDAGAQGPAGPQGEPGRGLTSFDELIGLPCSVAGDTGAISIRYGAGNEATIVCTVRGGGGPSSALRVNEVMTGMTGAAANEFVELVNAGAEPVDAGGHRVVYRSAAGTSDTLLATVPAGTVIAPGGHYLLGGGAYAGSVAADQSFATGLAATAGGDRRSQARTARSSTRSATAPPLRTAWSRAGPAAAPPTTRARAPAWAGAPMVPTRTTTRSTSPSRARPLRAERTTERA